MKVYVLYDYESPPIAVSQSKEGLTKAVLDHVSEWMHIGPDPKVEIKDDLIFVKRLDGFTSMYEFAELDLLP